jgi:hypothetical protein
MLITRELLLAILSYYAVFPSFLRVLRLFGARISEANPSGGFFYQSLSRSPSSPDTSLYGLRHGCGTERPRLPTSLGLIDALADCLTVSKMFITPCGMLRSTAAA